MKTVHILHFSDLLCIWAYVAQARIDELCAEFGDGVYVDRHFVNVFGRGERGLKERWRERGGLKAYAQHAHGIAQRFEHVEVHEDFWLRNPPSTSMTPHLFLKAVRIAEADGEVDERSFLRTLRAMRRAFFGRAEEICTRASQLAIAEELEMPRRALEHRLDSGEAHAALSLDFDLCREHDVRTSPTLMFNDGRQRLIGNVGYRVIEANVRELCGQRPEDLHSWC